MYMCLIDHLTKRSTTLHTEQFIKMEQVHFSCTKTQHSWVLLTDVQNKVRKKATLQSQKTLFKKKNHLISIINMTLFSLLTNLLMINQHTAVISLYVSDTDLIKFNCSIGADREILKDLDQFWEICPLTYSMRRSTVAAVHNQPQHNTQPSIFSAYLTAGVTQ